VAKVLRSVPGQKNILLYSPGLRAERRPARRPQLLSLPNVERELASANARVFSVNTTTGSARRSPWESSRRFAGPSGRTTGGKYFGDVNYSTRIARTSKIPRPATMSWASPWRPLGTESTTTSRSRSERRVRGPRPAGLFQSGSVRPALDIERHVHLLGLISGDEAAAKRSSSSRWPRSPSPRPAA